LSTGNRIVPIIVLTPGFCGEKRLEQLLQRDADVFCTSTTGILAACEISFRAWQRVEGLSIMGNVSPLAMQSVRAMANAMITSMVARYGKRRWCEIATLDPRAASSFLMLFPGTRVIILHRACEDFVYSVLNSSPWGVSGGAFAQSVSAYPNNPVAAISTWWADRSRTLLAFADEHSDSCVCLRFEDLVLKEENTVSLLSEFLEIDLGGKPAFTGMREKEPLSGMERSPGCGVAFPVDDLPLALVVEINAIQAKLGYSPLSQDRRMQT
jgi:hypothetical protein